METSERNKLSEFIETCLQEHNDMGRLTDGEYLVNRAKSQ
jgi:hypothetical protein